MKKLDRCSRTYLLAKTLSTNELFQTRDDLTSERDALLERLIVDKSEQLLDKLVELNLFIRTFEEFISLRASTITHRIIYKAVTSTRGQLKKAVIGEVKTLSLSNLFALIKRPNLDKSRSYLEQIIPAKKQQENPKPLFTGVASIACLPSTFKPYEIS